MKQVSHDAIENALKDSSNEKTPLEISRETPKKKRKRVEVPKKTEEKAPKVDLAVWKLIGRYLPRDYEEINLDEPWVTPAQRIKERTEKYKNLSIIESFEKELGQKINVSNPDDVNEVVCNTRIGDLISLYIDSVSPEGVTFSGTNYKEIFTTRLNLWKYPKFHEYLPLQPVLCQVVEKDKQRTIVDIIGPMINNFIMSRTKEGWRQNRLDPSEIQTVKMRNLTLTRGGFLGDAEIPNVSEFLGQPYTMKAFLPGSQLTLNVTNEFEKWEGEEIDTFVTSFDTKSHGAGLVLSRKSYIKHLGHLRLRELFNSWCEQTKEWDVYSNEVREGIVTGVINSSKKCGVFVELPDENITGMVSVPADQLTSYPANAKINIKFTGFEEELVYDSATEQLQHTNPFEIVDGAIKKVNVKPLFELAV